MHARFGVLLLAPLSIASAGCVHEPLNLETEAAVAHRVRAAAPAGFVAAALGVPLDADFNPLIGGGAGPLFAGQPSCASMGSWSSERGIIQNHQELKANLRAWFADGGLDSQQTHTYAFYRAMQLTQVCEVPPGAPLRRAPRGAVYYTSKVYLGHSYTVVVHGESRAFNAGIGANFLRFGGSASTFAEQYNVMHSGFGRGLQPKSEDALFSTPELVAKNYMTVNDEPDAIVVEYTQLPYVEVPPEPAPAPERLIEVRFISIEIGASGAAASGHSPWRMWVQCYVNDQPQEEPVVFLDQQVRISTISTSFARQIRARDGDILECKVWGTYERFYESQKLGRSSTGSIRQLEVGASLTKELEGADANANYTITWSATRLPLIWSNPEFATAPEAAAPARQYCRLRFSIRAARHGKRSGWVRPRRAVPCQPRGEACPRP
jgi:hypothetical protein